MTIDDEFLTLAADRAPTDPLELSIRELLGKWGFRRRGYWVVDEIRKTLGNRGLATMPDFESGWIDNYVQVVPISRVPEPTPMVEVAAEETTTTGEIGLRVSSLRSANAPVVSITPQQSLWHAQSLLMRFDYSQLPVLSGQRDVRGAVTWESIAQARMRRPEAGLKDALVPALAVDLQDDLLPLIPRIIERGFVLVLASDRTIAGLVTLADVSEEFVLLAGPFFLLGEVERRLRRGIDRCIPIDKIASVRDPDSRRTVESADDLTLGEYIRLLEQPENWAMMQWEAERTVFLEAMQTVREVRNDIMHFSPDPIEQERLSEVRAFLRWLRVLDP